MSDSIKPGPNVSVRITVNRPDGRTGTVTLNGHAFDVEAVVHTFSVGIEASKLLVEHEKAAKCKHDRDPATCTFCEADAVLATTKPADSVRVACASCDATPSTIADGLHLLSGGCPTCHTAVFMCESCIMTKGAPDLCDECATGYPTLKCGHDYKYQIDGALCAMCDSLRQAEADEAALVATKDDHCHGIGSGGFHDPAKSYGDDNVCRFCGAKVAP